MKNSQDLKITITAQIDRISTTKDGGVRISLDTGLDSIDSVQELIKLKSQGDLNVSVSFEVMELDY